MQSTNPTSAIAELPDAPKIVSPAALSASLTKLKPTLHSASMLKRRKLSLKAKVESSL
jgi:hypothetical protein